MVLRPERPFERPKDVFVPAWEAIARVQKTLSTMYRLVRQPDHARLSGQIVERLAIAGAPPVDDDIVRGIGLHDEGWADFDSGRKRLNATPARYSATNIALSDEGRPRSFLEIRAEDFLRAWCVSVETAEAAAPIAGLIVSGHFQRIGHFGVGTGTYSKDDSNRVREFIAEEENRYGRLLRQQRRSATEVEYWTDVLQFCDLLSLYLCCGSEESVEFPQRIGPKGQTIRLQVQEGANVLSPSPFTREVEFSLEAQTYPGGINESPTKLNWRIQ